LRPAIAREKRSLTLRCHYSAERRLDPPPSIVTIEPVV
jgi:hypothetical protein